MLGIKSSLPLTIPTILLFLNCYLQKWNFCIKEPEYFKDASLWQTPAGYDWAGPREEGQPVALALICLYLLLAIRGECPAQPVCSRPSPLCAPPCGICGYYYSSLKHDVWSRWGQCGEAKGSGWGALDRESDKLQSGPGPALLVPPSLHLFI